MNYIKNCKKLLAATVMLTIGTCGNQVSAQTHTANDRNGVPGLKVTLNESRIRHSGNEIVFYPIFQKTGNKNIGQLCIDNNRYAWIDGEEPLITYMPSTLFEVPADGEHVWHQYVVRVAGGRRDALAAALARQGIGTDVHYAVPPHLQPCYCGRLAHGPLPVAERLADEVLSLPVATGTTEDDAAEIALAINGIAL